MPLKVCVYSVGTGFYFDGRILDMYREDFTEGYMGCVGHFDGLQFEPNGYHWLLIV